MTDLISSLADSIVALINSKPQSPTKAEVVELIESVLADAERKTFSNTLANCTDLNEASLEVAIREINRITWDQEAIMCSGSTDGSHSWTLDEYKRGDGTLVAHLYRCPCGATKR